MTTPPQHRVTAAIEFIPRSDPAWDFDRANPETTDNPSHVLVQYLIGATRYDLAAEGPTGATREDGSPVLACARSYLKPGSEPRTMRLRRMGIFEVSRCLDIGSEHDGIPSYEARLHALAASLLEVRHLEGWTEDEVAARRNRAGKLPEVALDELAELLGADAVLAGGLAAIRASSAPTAAEKKPSAS